MRALRRFVTRLASAVRGRRESNRVREELAEHLELLTEDYVRSGLPPDEARRRAHVKLGGSEAIVEAYQEVAGWPGIEAFWQDVCYAARSYRRTPGFALVIVLTLGLAIGANTAIFSLLNALALRDLPVRDPGTLVQLSTVTPTEGASELTFSMFRELSARQQVFASVIGTWGYRGVTIGDADTVAHGLLWAATGNLYEELGIRPAAGRLLDVRDMTLDPPAAQPVAVLGYGFWQRHYRGDIAVIGRTIQVDGIPFTVIGVAPNGFTGFAVTTEPDVTIPLTATPLLSGASTSTLTTSASRSIGVVGRLKAGVTIEQAHAQLATIWPTVRHAALPPTYTEPRRSDFLSIGLDIAPAAKGLERELRKRYVQPLLILLGIAGVVLLIACTNVASLMLSRASARRHEIGVRLALGGSRWRVGRQLITEGVMLSLAGAVCGVALSFWVCAELTTIVFAEFTVPVVFDGRPDVNVVGLTTGIAIAVGLVCSVLPAWQGTRATPTTALQSEGRTFSATGRAGRMLVGVQLALSIVLLTTAGVLVRSLVELRALDTGVERSDDVAVAYPAAAQPGAYDGIDNDAYYPQVLQRLESLPGVRRASVSLLKPGAGGGFRDVVLRLEATQDAAGVTATRSPVAPGFFAAVGIPMAKGRDFDWRDNSRGTGVTILSQSLARQLFGDDEPLGQHVRVGLDPSRAALEVIGVAADARLYEMKSPDVLAAYTPALQDQYASYKCFVVRGDGVSLAAIREAVESLGREKVRNIVTLQHITDQSLLPERLAALMSSFFGSMVLLLAGVGLFGLMAYAVTQRRREIGIRMALGANRQRVVRDIVSEGLAIALAGLASGAIAAFVAVRVVRPLLFGVTAQDPSTLAGAAAALLAIAVVACAVPAWRAARVDPMVALRCE